MAVTVAVGVGVGEGVWALRIADAPAIAKPTSRGRIFGINRRILTQGFRRAFPSVETRYL